MAPILQNTSRRLLLKFVQSVLTMFFVSLDKSVLLHGRCLKSDSHVPESFCQIKIFPDMFEKIPSFVCLVFENETQWILKL